MRRRKRNEGGTRRSAATRTAIQSIADESSGTDAKLVGEVRRPIGNAFSNIVHTLAECFAPFRQALDIVA
jgi:hypothetical protein